MIVLGLFSSRTWVIRQFFGGRVLSAGESYIRYITQAFPMLCRLIAQWSFDQTATEPVR
jgi:hypothetical protein